MGTHRTGSVDDAAASLRREIGHLQHELRRVQDGLERNPTHALQQRARQLRANIALCERELAAELRNSSARPDDG
jgi:phage-related minor tail protein